ncbi:DUF602-domain-containing protein [Acrodontium crateriforme]|uniref:DUF602-domain-containing protein n=1 Tax=Acrodontium crateriforme TaxID=150365 RepID=A0AAQ3R8R0_9PEZI|nr:DUF602-domain-containing protein [Acrodontium crateriforme]
MGNDGGSIPTRRELVKEAARNPTTSQLKESQHEQQHFHWTTDPISNAPLARPIVSDSAGRLYNKDTILEFLIQGARKDDAERVCRGGVNSLKDVVEVHFELDGDATKTANEVWKCPVTNTRLGPGSKAAYLVPCGHAFSGSALKEVSSSKCLVCDVAYAPSDVIPILPLAETDVARLALRMQMLKEKGLAHSLKKSGGKESKKRKKKEQEKDEGTEVNGEKASKPANSSTAVNGLEKQENERINNASTATLTAKVMEEQERAKKRKMENDNVRSLFSTRDKNAYNTDFMTRGFSVPTKR